MTKKKEMNKPELFYPLKYVLIESFVVLLMFFHVQLHALLLIQL
jgi:hypothetical protein